MIAADVSFVKGHYSVPFIVHGLGGLLKANFIHLLHQSYVTFDNWLNPIWNEWKIKLIEIFKKIFFCLIVFK